MNNKTYYKCAMRELVEVILLRGRLYEKFYRVDSIGQLCSRIETLTTKVVHDVNNWGNQHKDLPRLLILLPPPLSSALEPAVPISTPVVPVFDLLKPSQPQVIDATLSTLSIMTHLDTLQELFVSMDSHIDARLGDVATKIFTSTIDILDSARQVDATPMLKDIDQVATPVLEEIDGVVDPIIVT
ncbi:hypothetical protein CK203_054784 [Vitis vinifera]|uniref:Uncharacterized protein n=1 Tax=Vitis vinifera TaxID=29760 RepID=A0A438GIS4_VITVI|nr:hypothetical protein CK203_054784 [Vitis vinifera]